MTVAMKNKGGRPKTGTGDIPAWFDIGKYRGAKDFTAAQWYEQLCVRRCFFLMQDWLDHIAKTPSGDIAKMFPNSPRSLFPETEQHPERIRDAFNILCDNPLNNLELFCATDKVCSKGQHHYDFLVNGGAYALRGRPLDAFDGWFIEGKKCGIEIPAHGDISNMGAWVDITVREEVDALLFPATQSMGAQITKEKIEEIKRKFYSQPNTQRFGKHIPILVDIAMPDAVLIKEFQEILASLKNNYPERKDLPTFRAINFKKWYESGVLPYLDLMIWGRLTGTKVTQPAFSQQIYTLMHIDDNLSDGKGHDGWHASEEGEDFIRTTDSYAGKLLTPTYLRGLLSQATREASGIIPTARSFSPVPIPKKSNKSGKKNPAK